jgi:hypothetical protein
VRALSSDSVGAQRLLEAEHGVEGEAGTLAAGRHSQGVDLSQRKVVLLGANHAHRLEACQDLRPTAYCPGAAGCVERVHARGSLGDGGEEGDLRPAQVLDWLVEVAARGVGDAPDAVPVGDDAEVANKDSLAPVTGGHQERGEGLDRLAGEVAVLRVLHPCDLHGEGRGA